MDQMDLMDQMDKKGASCDTPRVCRAQFGMARVQIYRRGMPGFFMATAVAVPLFGLARGDRCATGVYNDNGGKALSEPAAVPGIFKGLFP